MTSHQVSREYRIRGMDRILYQYPPEWAEGTFHQFDEFEGLLRLHSEAVGSRVEAQAALSQLDRIAERFRLAVSKRIGCSLTSVVTHTVEPHFGPAGVEVLEDSVHASDSAVSAVLPREPPLHIEQIPEGSARWIHTLTEARTMSAHPDEVLKRLFLIIEELRDLHSAVLTEADVAMIDELALVRDFVSHPICDRKKVPPFIAARLPSAVVSPEPTLSVRYDRTDVEHRNFVGRFDQPARLVVNKLLESAIQSL